MHNIASDEFGQELLLSAMDEVLSAVDAMRRGEAPTDPDAARALSAANHVARWMDGVQRELLVSGLLTHGEAAVALGVPRATAQKRREAAAAAEARHGLDAYQADISHRPRGTNPAEWYGTPTPTAPQEYWDNQRDVIAAGKITNLTKTDNPVITTHGGSFEVAGTLHTFWLYGRNEFVSNCRIITVNGESMELMPNMVYEVGGYMITAYPDGLHGYETKPQTGNTVVNIATGTVGIQSANEVNNRTIEL